MAALRMRECDEIEGLLYIKYNGRDRGWRRELLTEQISNKVEEKFLLCSYCSGLVREAYQCKVDEKHILRCSVCLPLHVQGQPAQLTREAINEKSICCPLKLKGCDWTDSVATVTNHLNVCGFILVYCPLKCVELGDRRGKVVKVERRLIPEHKEKWCPQRKLNCEYCNRGVKACEMNSHLELCGMFPVKCPNSCIMPGTWKSGPGLMERRNVRVHLSTECPQQVVECPFSNKGCSERMKRCLVEEHKIYKCPQRDLTCEYCQCAVKACEMDSHLNVCEMFPVKCPNSCVESGNTSSTQVKRGNLSTHLSEECPLQIVKCPFLDHGCREEMERKQLDSHERDSIHVHFKLSLIKAEEVREMQVESSSKILCLEQANASKDLEIKQLKNIISNRSKTEWRINGINEKIRNKPWNLYYYREPYQYRHTATYCDPYSYSNPFYIGKYKCQCKMVWSHAALKGKIGCFISIVKGRFDAALQWPFIYQVKFKLHNQIMNGNDHIWSHRVSEEDMQRFPECFQRPTKVRNRAFGVASFIPNNELLTEKYCKEDAISISISVKQLAVL